MNINKRASAGVTLIELMVVVVIIAILAGIAYPSYTNYVRQSRRSDAQIALLRLAAAQEKFFADCNRYAQTLTGGPDCAAGTLGWTSTLSPNGHYQLSVAASSGNMAFTATATPVAGGLQASDADCTTLTINHLGVKGATGNKPSLCWKQ